MRKKFVAVAIMLMVFAFIFTGCGGGTTGGSNQGGTNGNNNKPTTAQLIVIIKDDAGNSLSGVTVSLNQSKETDSTETDSSGKAIFDSLKPGEYAIKATKEGYEDADSDVVLNAGDKKTVNLTLEKSESGSVDEVNDLSNLKSYKAVFEYKSSEEGEGSKILVFQDDYGKKQHMIVYDSKGKVTFESYVFGDKAKIKSGDMWIEIPASAVKGMTKATIGFAENMMRNTEEYFNEHGSNGDINYTFKKVGSEVVNGYPTYKYHLEIKGKTGDNNVSYVGNMWIISKGPYKGYVTRLIITFKDNKTSGTLISNLTDIGKDMHITKP